jgi:hypothetical protein
MMHGQQNIKLGRIVVRLSPLHCKEIRPYVKNNSELQACCVYGETALLQHTNYRFFIHFTAEAEC